MPRSIAILTASDPEGVITHAPEENRARSAELRAAIEATGAACISVEAGSRDFFNQEAAFIVGIGLPEAVAIGRRFR